MTIETNTLIDIHVGPAINEVIAHLQNNTEGYFSTKIGEPYQHTVKEYRVVSKQLGDLLYNLGESIVYFHELTVWQRPNSMLCSQTPILLKAISIGASLLRPEK